MDIFLPTLPTADLPATRDFWRRLGFTFSPDFRGEPAECLMLTEQAGVLLMERAFYERYHSARRSSGDGVVLVLSANSFAEVERLCAAAKVAGAGHVRMPIPGERGGRGSFRDPDGHLWEVVQTHSRGVGDPADQEG